VSIRDLDLNLLVALDTVLAERSVARAAKRLHVTPSAISNALARLRAALGDPLVARSGRGIVPTPRALELAPVLSRSLEELGGARSRRLRRRLRPGDHHPAVHDRHRRRRPDRPRAAPGQAARRRDAGRTPPGRRDRLPGGLRRPRVDRDRRPHRPPRSRARDPHEAPLRRGDDAGGAERSSDRPQASDPTGAGPAPPHRRPARARSAQPRPGRGLHPGQHRPGRRGDRADLRSGSTALPASLLGLLGGPLGLRAVASPIPLPATPIHLVWSERTHHDPAMRAFRDLIIRASAPIGRAT
jgi:DNA-binding transcriptional LysR family regulator